MFSKFPIDRHQREMNEISTKNLFANTYRVSLVITKPFKTLNWGPKMLYFAILGIC